MAVVNLAALIYDKRMSSTSSGRRAEDYVSRYLQNNGYKLVAQNWRTRWCEIDLIMMKLGVVYFIEVKYRSSVKWGGGLEYITNKKQKQMNFAAQMWISQNKWDGDARLAAVEVTEPIEVSPVDLLVLD